MEEGGNDVTYFAPIPEMIPLLQSVKRYMGPKGMTLTDGLLKIIDFITSEPGEELLKTLGEISSLGGKQGKPVSVYTASRPMTINLNWSLILFLILILFVIPANPVNFSSARSALFRRK